MNYSFEYIDIILLAMIAGFIFLRLRGILGRRTENEKDFSNRINEKFINEKINIKENKPYKFDDAEKEMFLKGAKIAYENIITAFGNGDISNVKSLLDKKVYTQFLEAIKERKNKKIKSETTFIGIKSAKAHDFKEIGSTYNISVDFISEIIASVKDQENKTISGDPNKIKIVSDTWKFAKDKRNQNPNWLLIETQI